MNIQVKNYSKQPIKRYMPGLDGLRALSVLAVIAYHLKLKWAEGGLLGVGIFFVISGYLITDQIIMGWKQKGRFRLLEFWIGRVRRLLPAMFTMLICVALWLLFVDTNRLISLKGEFISSFFYVNNWWLIIHQVSYFESFGPPSPIGHLWSLAIEEQFYLIWPIILTIGLKHIVYKRKLLLWMVGATIASVLAMALIYVPGDDPSRVYYGTDTRAFALLVGAVLAVIWPSWRLKEKENVSAEANRFLDMIGLIGICTLFIMIFTSNKFDESLYRGGFLYLSLVTAVVIAVLAHPASRLGKVMGCKPLRWIGVRSYSLYIWHFPIIILSNPDVNMDGSDYTRILLQLIATFILASLSFKYIEEPLRRGKKHRSNDLQLNRDCLSRSRIKPSVPVVLILLLLVFTYWFESLNQTDTIKSVSADHQNIQKDEFIQKEPIQPDSGELLIQSNRITAIGDSVILDAAPFLKELLPGIIIDGKVGRQMRQAEELTNQLEDTGKLGEQVIIELGTNGYFHKKTLISLLNHLSDKKVILVNTRVPKEWQDSVNELISEAAHMFDNVSVVDWHAASVDKHSYFSQDGVHLSKEGAKYFASLLVDAVKNEKQ
ncbi:acetyltransferase [Paenibacillus oralis]|uniref:Acetyltransferase n=2 Tax=Paenibacillus oralis TaxID=2490856 RepID=A0A3P3UE85_9BACL|nr:acetyltransferase [Paenibacillus oralis]